jgi:hypothetical protein
MAKDNDDVTFEADAEVGRWSASLRNASVALQPDLSVIRIAEEVIRTRCELTAIRQALEKIANK